MAGIFLKLFNMSVTACWIVLAVIAFRFLFRKAPKWINCVLWGVVGLRLVLPFSFKSILSLIPSTQTITPNPESVGRPFIVNTGIDVLNSNINEYIGSHYYEGVTRPANNFVNTLDIVSTIWLIGMAALIIYGMVSYVRLALRVRPSLNKEDSVYYCDNIDTPFILGIIKPKIYLPSYVSDEQAAYVIAHEKAHLKRKDHWWKPLGFALLTVYWFNPVMWLAYILLCRDIEKACDEKVIKSMDCEDKKGYSHALVSCSVKRFSIAACPLAFGEVAVKDRIKSVLNYKKPAFWIIIVALLVGVGVAVCFLTDPKDKDDPDTFRIVGENGIYNILSGTDCDLIEFNFLSGSTQGLDPYIEVKWTNNSSQNLCFGREFTLYKDGAVVDPEVPFVWTLELLMVMPGFSFTETYKLTSFSIPEGDYRIEKEFYLDGDKETKYTAYINFTIDGKLKTSLIYTSIDCYSPAEEVYVPVIISATPPFPTFLFYDGDAYIQEDGVFGYTYPKILGKLQKVDIIQSGFIDRIDERMDRKGIAAELENNNLNSYYVESPDTNRSYYLFEQKNGDVYMAGIEIDSDAVYGIFKMQKSYLYRVVRGHKEVSEESLELARLKERLEQLQEEVNEVFNLSTDRGLQVWVSSFAEGNYRFSITDGANRTKNIIELTALPSFSAEEMKIILSTYNLPSSDIAVIPYQNGLSSYLWFDMEDDVEMLRQMLGLE